MGSIESLIEMSARNISWGKGISSELLSRHTLIFSEQKQIFLLSDTVENTVVSAH
jgi:hypothetical protein